jgi:hypothetical protein
MAKKTTQAQKIRNHFTANPGKTVSEVAKAMGVSYQVAYVTKRNMDKNMSELAYQIGKGRNPKQDWKVLRISTSDTPLPVTMEEPKSDPVNHPAHYKVGGIETIDFIEAKRLNYNMGNAVKYIARADHKGNRKQDLEKAVWYLQRELSHSI